MMGFSLGFGLFHMLWILLVWIGLLLIAIWLIGLLFPAAKKQSETPPASALDILKARYAKGELTKEQYQEMLQVIRHSPASSLINER